MKHWLFMRATNRPSQWDGISKAVNNTDRTFVYEDGSTLVVPANTRLLLPFLRKAAGEYKQGPILRQFDKDITNLVFLQDENDVLITRSFLPASMRTPDNTRILDLDLMERALDKYEWVSLALILNKQESTSETTLLKDSQYIVRGKDNQLEVLDGVDDIKQNEQINVLTFFVAFRLAKTNGYVLMCNHNIISGHAFVSMNTNERTISSSHDQTGNIVKFAFEPKVDCKYVANTLIVEKDYLEVNIGHSSLIYYKTNTCLLNNNFTVESSWDAKVEGNKILVKKQLGMGYFKVTFDCYDLTKPYLVSDDRKITIESLLLGV